MLKLCSLSCDIETITLLLLIFARMERAYFGKFNFRHLAKQFVNNVKNMFKTLEIGFHGSLICFWKNRKN